MSRTTRTSWRRGWLVALAAGLGAWLATSLIPRAAGREPVCQGEPLSVWLKRFDSADRATHNQALAALQALGPKSTARLAEALLRPDSLFTRVVHGVVSRFPQLKFHLDATERRRIHGVQMLDEIGPAAWPSVPALIRTVQDPNRHVPPAIVQRALLDIGPASAPAVIDALDDERTAVREFAAVTLFTLIEDRGITGTVQPNAVATLVRMLKDRDSHLRSLAAATLARLGPHARPAVPALIGALHDTQPEVRAQAASALGEVGLATNEAVAPLIDLLADATAPARENAAVALGRFGPAACNAAPALVSSLLDEEESVRVTVANALGRIGVTRGPVVPALVDRLQDPAPLVRASAATALGKFGPAAEAAMPALIRTLTDGDGHVRGDAARALGKMGPAAVHAVRALADALRDDQNSVRIGAIEALGEIGPPAAGAIPALLKAQVNDFAGIGRYVAVALQKIDPTTAAKQAAMSSAGD